jgi:hypothetical protein
VHAFEKLPGSLSLTNRERRIMNKTDKMKVAELYIEEPIDKFLRREYHKKGVTVVSLTELLNQKTGLGIGTVTVWKWLKAFNIRRKEWK